MKKIGRTGKEERGEKDRGRKNAKMKAHERFDRFDGDE